MSTQRRTWFYYALTLILLAPITYLTYSLALDVAAVEQGRLHSAVWYSVVQRTHTAIVVVDADSSRIVGWNKGAENLFLWSDEQVLGNSMAVFLPADYIPIHNYRLKDPVVRRRLEEKSIVVNCWVKVNDPHDPLRFVRVHIRGLGGDGPCRFLLTFELTESVVEDLSVMPRPKPTDTKLVQPQPQSPSSYINLLRDS